VAVLDFLTYLINEGVLSPESESILRRGFDYGYKDFFSSLPAFEKDNIDILFKSYIKKRNGKRIG